MKTYLKIALLYIIFNAKNEFSSAQELNYCDSKSNFDLNLESKPFRFENKNEIENKLNFNVLVDTFYIPIVFHNIYSNYNDSVTIDEIDLLLNNINNHFNKNTYDLNCTSSN